MEGDNINNLSNVFNFISQNNIEPEQVFSLVEKIKTMDLDDENNLRQVIREVGRIAHKPIDKFKEDQLVSKIKQDGINENLLNFI